MAKNEVKAVVVFRKERRRDGMRLVAITTDSVVVREALINHLPVINDTPRNVKVKNTAGYVIKHKTVSFFRRLGFIFKATRYACSEDFQYAD